jgi:hypothetical protein
MIGIKIADGTYIPILDEFERDKKKVVLTTVRDDQNSVQIDLYRGSGSGMEEPQYLDTLKIDTIEEALKGEPEIELVVGIDDEGKLVATARDLKGGDAQSFSVSLDSSETEGFSDDSESDFDIPFTKDVSADAGSATTPSYSPMNGQSALIHEEKNRKPLLVAAALAVLIAAGVLCWFFLLRGRDEESVTEAQPASPPPAVSAPVQPASPPPAASAPVQPAAPPVAQTPAQPAPAPQPAAPPVAQTPAQPAPAPQPAAPQKPAAADDEKTGVWYSIVKGDNLWNLSKSFYRTPWLYPKIAKENNIRNPDLIFKGKRILIPDVETAAKR